MAHLFPLKTFQYQGFLFFPHHSTHKTSKSDPLHSPLFEGSRLSRWATLIQDTHGRIVLHSFSAEPSCSPSARCCSRAPRQSPVAAEQTLNLLEEINGDMNRKNIDKPWPHPPIPVPVTTQWLRDFEMRPQE